MKTKITNKIVKNMARYFSHQTKYLITYSEWRQCCRLGECFLTLRVDLLLIMDVTCQCVHKTIKYVL